MRLDIEFSHSPDLAEIRFVPSWWRRLLRAPTITHFVERTSQGRWLYDGSRKPVPEFIETRLNQEMRRMLEAVRAKQ